MSTPTLTGPDFSRNDGLLPAIAQDAQTGEVLMLAWMNAESFAETVRTGNAVYYSRSRGKLWRKGEESGHVQTVRGIYIDCDADTILLKVDQRGVACHEGYRSCFFRLVTKDGMQVVSERLVEPEQIYRQPAKMIPPVSPPARFSNTPSMPTRPSGGSMLNRACVAIGYFSFLVFLFQSGIPNPATFPLLLLGICGLMTLALLAGVFLTALRGQERRQFNLLSLFALIAACAMLLGTVTGLIRASDRLASGGPASETELTARIMPYVLALGVLFISFPFAVYLAEAFIWSAASMIRIPRVRSFVRRLVP